MCRAVSEEVAQRAGLWPREDDSADSRQVLLKQLGPTPQGFEHVAQHTFVGSEECLGEHTDASRRHDAEPSPDDFDPYQRGEAGCVPLLRGDFYRLVNVAVYENASLPKVCTAGGFSSSWSASYRDAWRKLVAKARRDHSYAEHSLVDFRWRRAAFPSWLEKGPQAVAFPDGSCPATASVPSSETDRSDAATCLQIPIDFEAARSEAREPKSETRGVREGWRLVLGSATSGTCFRSAAPSALRRRDDHWRRNAIANLFHCPIVYRGRAMLHVVRHGVVGFSKDPSAHVTSHLDLTLRYIIAEQLKSGLPLRVVSINLLSHYKATGEPDMAERQLASFQEVLPCTAQSLCACVCSRNSRPSSSPAPWRPCVPNPSAFCAGRETSRASTQQSMLVGPA